MFLNELRCVASVLRQYGIPPVRCLSHCSGIESLPSRSPGPLGRRGTRRSREGRAASACRVAHAVAALPTHSHAVLLRQPARGRLDRPSLAGAPGSGASGRDRELPGGQFVAKDGTGLLSVAGYPRLPRVVPNRARIPALNVSFSKCSMPLASGVGALESVAARASVQSTWQLKCSLSPGVGDRGFTRSREAPVSFPH
jgi:hypothetical protein